MLTALDEASLALLQFIKHKWVIMKEVESLHAILVVVLLATQVVALLMITYLGMVDVGDTRSSSGRPSWWLHT